MELFKVCGAAILVTVIFCLVRLWNPSFDLPLRLAAAVFFLGLVLARVKPFLAEFLSMVGGVALSPYASVLLSAVGVAILTQTVSEICRDCREGAVAGYVELAGRVEILLLCLPLLREILGVLEELL